MGRPLDKKEAVLYGQFVNAAYKMFERNPKMPFPEPQSCDIPAPYELVAWLHMSDFFFWWREKPKFYGFIARHREQKRNFVLAIRGTKGWVEWLDDSMARLVPFRQVPNAASSAGPGGRLREPPAGRPSPKPRSHLYRRPSKSRKPSASSWRI